MSAPAPWFDFKGRADVVRDAASGALSLKLAEPFDGSVVEKAQKLGWVRLSDDSFVHHHRFGRMSEVVDKLTAFMPRAEVIEAVTSTPGGAPAARPGDDGHSLAQVEDLVSALPRERIDRILETVRAAQASQAVGVLAAELPFGGDAFAVWRQLESTRGRELAFAAMIHAVDEIGRPSPAGRHLAASITRAAVGDDAEWANVMWSLEEDIGIPVLKRVRTQLMPWAERLAGDFGHRLDDVLKAALVEEGAGRVSFRLYDDARFQRRNQDPDLHGLVYRNAAHVPDLLAHGHRLRIGMALEALAATLGVEPTDVMGGKGVMVRVEGSTPERLIGEASGSSTGAYVSLSTIWPGTLVRALAQAVEVVSPRSEALLEALRDHGIVEQARKLVALSPFDRDLRSELDAERDICARTIASAVADMLYEQGDPDCIRAGGALSLVSAFDWGVRPQLARAFTAQVAGILNLGEGLNAHSDLVFD